MLKHMLTSMCRLKIKSSKRLSDLLKVTSQIMELGLELTPDAKSKPSYIVVYLASLLRHKTPFYTRELPKICS